MTNDETVLVVRIGDRDGKKFEPISVEGVTYFRELLPQSDQGAIDGGGWELCDACSGRALNLDAEIPSAGRFDIYPRPIEVPRIWPTRPEFRYMARRSYMILPSEKQQDIFLHMADSGYSVFKPTTDKLEKYLDKVSSLRSLGIRDIVAVGSSEEALFRRAQELAGTRDYLHVVDLKQYDTSREVGALCYAFLTDLMHEEALKAHAARNAAVV